MAVPSAPSLRPSHARAVAWGRSALRLASGALISGLILFGIAQAQKTRIEERPPPAADLRKTILPEPPPPPPPARVAPEPPPPAPLELAPTPAESPHRIAAVLLPSAPALARPDVAPRLDFSLEAFRPDPGLGRNPADHVYQRGDVDQPAVPVYRKIPSIPRDLVEAVPNPRVTFVFVVNTDGSVSDLRLWRSSGNDRFDTLVLEALRQWKFKPAVRGSRAVRMMLEQPVHVKLPSGSRFTID